MTFYTFNKIAGFFLFTLLIVFGLNGLADLIYAAKAPDKPGMVVEVAPGDAGGTSAEAPEVPFATFLAKADPVKGQSAAKACAACHSFEDGGPNKTGPHLYDVVGRQIASIAGFAYDNALQSKASQDWTYDNLNAFLRKPKGWAPGTKMTFAGVRNDQKRANLIAYLRTLSANPVPLPDVTPTTSAEAQSGEDGGASQTNANQDSSPAVPAADSANTPSDSSAGGETGQPESATSSQ